MSTRLRLTVFILLLALIACAAKNELRENQQKWASQNITHYRFEVTIGCNCPWRSLMPLKIEVKDGQIVSMTDKDDQPTPVNYADTFNRAASIEKLFAILDEAIGSASKVTVAYNPDYGYPQSIVIDESKLVYDDEIGYYVKSFEVLK
jgi:hypothetical protein